MITNIGYCHLEFLKSRDGVLKAKTEIFDYLEETGHIILNGDDDKLSSVGEVKGVRPEFFGIQNQEGLYADEIESRGLQGVSCRIHMDDSSFQVLIPLPGQHMVYNALAGAAVGRVYGLTAEQIKAGIESLQPLSGRFHIIEKNGITVIDDCYNANPVSMKASLELLTDALGRKVAILGDMGELGEREAEMHREVGAFAAALDLDVCVCVGPLSRGMAEAAKLEGTHMKVIHVESLEELLEGLDTIIREGDTILVKASHFMKFEKVVEALTGGR